MFHEQDIQPRNDLDIKCLNQLWHCLDEVLEPSEGLT